jgi:formate C-acetyltransferase
MGTSFDGTTKGVKTGSVRTIDSMDEFMNRFRAQLRLGVKEYVDLFLKRNVVYAPETMTAPFLSCFCRDCIARGLDINMGGAVYPSVHGAALMGLGTVCDSLAAIEQTVFVDRSLTLDQIREALLANFVGFEEVRATLLAAPKYGNNNDFVDKYAVDFVDFFADEFAKYKTPDGGGIYLIMAANTSNISAGARIGATPDGRLAGEPLSDAASPTYGRDTGGATTTVLSITKPDYRKVACGTVINQKFSPSMFSDGKREKLLSLIRVYFARGGQEMQINSTSPEILRDAMEHPENYGDLVVRVSGFSAYYVALRREVQTDILSRTQQDF